MKNSASKLAALASMMMAMGSVSDWPTDRENDLKPEDIDVTQHTVVQRGMKRFVIEGVEIFAINEKNAIKKFNKLKQK
jgi:hypothetical protein